MLIEKESQIPKNSYKWDIVWKNVLLLSALHIVAFKEFYLMVTLEWRWQTLAFSWFMGYFSGLGVTVGAHRYFTHRTYKAKLPLRLLLLCLQTITLQNSMYEWSRDHRVHHKFTDTDADPHNSLRGFFFSHMGWLLVRKHPAVMEKGKTVDMSDLKNDPLVMFQKKYFIYLGILVSVVIPVLIPWYFWNESLLKSWNVNILRFVMCLHMTWTVNSLAHTFGTKPYDQSITATENSFVATITAGEGWHNYHHMFPWDYRAVECDKYSGNLSTGLIHFMAKIGWAYDLKSPSPEMVKRRIQEVGAKYKVKCLEEAGPELSFVDNIDQPQEKYVR